MAEPNSSPAPNSPLTREQIEQVRKSLADDRADSAASDAVCDMALRSLSRESAIGDTVAVPREPTPEMWDAAWKSIGLPYRAKLSLHEIKTLFDKFHAAMLAAAPQSASPEDVARSAIAPQKPVAWLVESSRSRCVSMNEQKPHEGETVTPLYAAPPEVEPQKCSECNGTGESMDSVGMIHCPQCDGKGRKRFL